MSYQIKINLRKGGLVLSKRRSGKTHAILELLQEDRRNVLMVRNYDALKHILDTFRDKFGPLATRIICSDKELYLKGREFNPHKHLLIDEFFECSYRGPFFAATATADFPVWYVDNDSQLEAADIVSGILEGDISGENLSKQIKGL